MFKKFLTFLGAITFALIILGGIRYTIVAFSGSSADKSSLAYANDSVKAIAPNWNAKALVDRAHPALFAQTNPQQFTALLDKIREIGALQKLESCRGQSTISYPSLFKYLVGGSSSTDAAYLCVAKFVHGEAALVLKLHKDDKAGWQIVAFNVDSPFFKKAPTKVDNTEEKKP